MPIENRNLEPGTKLVATYKKEIYHALVVASAEGKVLYQLSPNDGKEYKSPSSLGTAVTGKACNGWAFWSVDTSPAAEEPTEPDAPAAAESTSTSEEPDQSVTTATATATDDSIEEDALEAVYSPLDEDADPPPKPASFRRVPN